MLVVERAEQDPRAPALSVAENVAENTLTDNVNYGQYDYDAKPVKTLGHDAYIHWFPPCRPCGHCPACGRGYDYPAYPPHYVPRWPRPDISLEQQIFV